MRRITASISTLATVALSSYREVPCYASVNEMLLTVQSELCPTQAQSPECAPCSRQRDPGQFQSLHVTQTICFSGARIREETKKIGGEKNAMARLTSTGYLPATFDPAGSNNPQEPPPRPEPQRHARPALKKGRYATEVPLSRKGQP